MKKHDEKYCATTTFPHLRALARPTAIVIKQHPSIFVRPLRALVGARLKPIGSVIHSSAELSTDMAGGRLWYGEIGW
ncbi:MAG TPA: hypothetical protein VEF72_19875 [Mycobacterium sp.]|nr:hypothetical protein [Mycobacterium sp.]